MLDVELVMDTAMDRTPCEVTGVTPGDNMYLNVNNLLQLGGRYVEPRYPTSVTSSRFQGCMRNLIHNGKVGACLV
ncbi:hypothetical protein DPMN_169417 [Dreissena polymorpha]|uniref:Laminin G domain-containing protein n=1 Tax=Dreissena polymorpha TaxID=45954 RepID=A0A9D4DWQ7_DREPO|nr:hypothetical protein DPMN_169417 [Dreissena polymorpha]